MLDKSAEHALTLLVNLSDPLDLSDQLDAVPPTKGYPDIFHINSELARIKGEGASVPQLTSQPTMITTYCDVTQHDARVKNDFGDWHRADILAALHKSGTTVVALSRASGLSNSSLSNVFYRSWPRGERIIADHLGVAPSVIWPSRYPLNDSA